MHGLKRCVTKHPNTPQSRESLQGSYDQHTTVACRGFTKTFGGGRQGLRQVTPGFRQLRHLVTPYASYATPLDELRPQPCTRCASNPSCLETQWKFIPTQTAPPLHTIGPEPSLIGCQAGFRPCAIFLALPRSLPVGPRLATAHPPHPPRA
eukprot:365383-Chlamydomonas_euryale.AAC.1